MTEIINSLTNDQCFTFGFVCGMIFDIIGSIICACSARKKYYKGDEDNGKV